MRGRHDRTGEIRIYTSIFLVGVAFREPFYPVGVPMGNEKFDEKLGLCLIKSNRRIFECDVTLNAVNNSASEQADRSYNKHSIGTELASGGEQCTTANVLRQRHGREKITSLRYA